MSRIITDDELLTAVLSTRTYAEAARQLGCSKNTITRRLQKDELHSRLIEMRKEILGVVNQYLLSKGQEAVDELYDLMKNSESDSVRLSASNAFLQHMGRLVEDENILHELQKMQIEDRMRRS